MPKLSSCQGFHPRAWTLTPGMRLIFASEPPLLHPPKQCAAGSQRRFRQSSSTMVISANQVEQSVPHKPLNKVFASLPTTVFTTMTNLANEHGSVNLGQGFPDEEGPESMKQVTPQLHRHLLPERLASHDHGIARLKYTTCCHPMGPCVREPCSVIGVEAVQLCRCHPQQTCAG